MNNSLELLYGALKNKDLTRAKNEYLNMKKLLDAFPFKNEEEKEEVLTDFISLRDQIKELESYLEEKAQKKKEEMRTEAERGIEQRKEQEISTIINQAEKLAKQKDFHKANFFYLNAKHKLEKIQEEETRMLLSDRLEKLKQKIMIEKISEKVEEQVVPLKKEISLLEKTRKKKELPEQSSEIYKNGLRELYAGKKEEAAKLFRKVLEINPNYVAAKIRLKEALGEA
jgi:tetratricopeptide (TPR) repeat protein